MTSDTLNSIGRAYGAAHVNGHGACTIAPPFDRMEYFYGQMLGAQDFKTEQAFFREKMKLHNRCAHGYGVVCGLEVKPKHGVGKPEPIPPASDEPDDSTTTDEIARLREKIEEYNRIIVKLRKQLEETDPSDEGWNNLFVQLTTAIVEHSKKEHELEHLETRESESTEEEESPTADSLRRCPTIVSIGCGFALDCEGNELVVRDELCFNLLTLLSDADQKTVQTPPTHGHGRTLFISLCYKDLPIEPMRPVLPEACGGVRSCHFGKRRDSVCVKVSLSQPELDDRCDPCCVPCVEQCVLLARIENFRPWRPLAPESIHNDARRHLTKYVTSRIEQINWVHGGIYDDEEYKKIFESGLVIRFSRPVLRQTLQQGVIDVLLHLGGGTISGSVYHLAGHITSVPLEQDPECTREVHFNFGQSRLENLSPGDRVFITIRAPFILDKCCCAVDGDHLGGLVGLTEEGHRPVKAEWSPPRICAEQLGRVHRLVSGNGIKGGNFESWFYVGPLQQENPE